MNGLGAVHIKGCVKKLHTYVRNIATYTYNTQHTHIHAVTQTEKHAYTNLHTQKLTYNNAETAATHI